MANELPSKSYARIEVKLPLPDLIEVQLEFFERLRKRDWRICLTSFPRSSPTTRA